jgi:hypothetical protein
MGELGMVLLIGAMLFFPILYFIVRGAVKDGTLDALIEYEKLKSEKSKSE